MNTYISLITYYAFIIVHFVMAKLGVVHFVRGFAILLHVR